MCNKNLDSDKAYYLQHVDFPLEELKSISESGNDIAIILKYFNIYRLKEEDALEYYNLLKHNKIIDKCIEILSDSGERLEVSKKLNIINEMIDLFNIKNTVGSLSEYNVKELYANCINYYNINNSLDNRDALRNLTLILIQIIDNYDFLAQQLFEDGEYLCQIMALAYPKQFNIKLDKVQEENQHILYFALWKIDMNCIEINEFSNWINKFIDEYNGKPFENAVINFTSSLCGKYFDSNTDLLKLLDKTVIRNKDFQHGFVIAYYNTMGATTSGINDVPNEYVERRDMLLDLKHSFKSCNMKSHENLVDEMIDDVNSRIAHFEKLGRN